MASSDDMARLDVSTDLACVILSKIHDVPTRAALMCVSRVWREAGKEKTSFPKELDFTTVPNLANATYEKIAAFMDRIEGIHIRLPPGSEWPRKKLHDGVALDRMRLKGTTVASWELTPLDFYVKHDRRKVRAFDNGPFDVWCCGNNCDTILDNERRHSVCIACDGKDTHVLCVGCADADTYHMFCEKCNAFDCNENYMEECANCEGWICMECSFICNQCDKTFCYDCNFGMCCSGSYKWKNGKACYRTYCEDCAFGEIFFCEACQGDWCEKCNDSFVCFGSDEQKGCSVTRCVDCQSHGWTRELDELAKARRRAPV